MLLMIEVRLGLEYIFVRARQLCHIEPGLLEFTGWHTLEEHSVDLKICPVLTVDVSQIVQVG